MSDNQMAFDCPGCGEVHVLPVGPSADGHQRPIWGYNGDPARPTFTPSVLARNGHHMDGEKKGVLVQLRGAHRPRVAL